MQPIKEDDFKGKSMGLPEMAVCIMNTQAMVEESINMQAKILAKLNGTTVDEEKAIASTHIEANFKALLKTLLIREE
ncbi:hypothetical protein IWX76_002433 [Pedobacter sp. CAN_A7]|uniref:hypothetical protein n=1 Tax=Pedobacter sp. CAN_A7 TaxID=2787722 RepID=UPI0018CA66E5